MRAAAAAAMRDADLERLAQLLDQRAVPFRGMDLERLDGYLSALVVGPEPVLPSEWTPAVWGGKPPRWSTTDEAERVHRLLMELWNDVVRRVALFPERLRAIDLPLITQPDLSPAQALQPSAIGVDWALGFMAGVRLRADAWAAWVDAEPWIADALAEITVLSTFDTADSDAASDASHAPLTERERLDIVAQIPALLHDLNVYRFDRLTPREPVRRAPIAGRNEPCPCGSGMKFKKCCGAPGKLH